MKGAKKEIKKSIVDHTYRDYSQWDISDLVDDSRKGLNEELFPAKLHKMLSTAEYAYIIAWKPHGRAWAVVNKSLFVSIVLPKYFNHSNFESFNRSVNGWGFKRLSREGPDEKSYYHELFLRGKLELTSIMARLIDPGKRLPNKAGEPDFYDISTKYPLPDPSSTPRFKPADDEDADNKARASPPIFTPPPATKRFRQSHSTQGAHSYGYNRHVPISYAQPPSPYAQHSCYSQCLPYAHHPPLLRTPIIYSPPTIFSTSPPNYTPSPCEPYHHPHGHFPYAPTTPRRAPNVLINHYPWVALSTYEWYPPTPSPQCHYYHPTANATIQQHEKYSSERSMPILHTNHEGHDAHLQHTIAENENMAKDERKSAAQFINAKSEYNQASNAVDPLISGPLVQSFEGLERHSSTVKTSYNEEVYPEIDAAPGILSRHAHEYDEQRRSVAQEGHNPLDISNFYDSPSASYHKEEWVLHSLHDKPSPEP